MKKQKAAIDVFASCCGTCSLGHMNIHGELTCWGSPPIFSGYYDEDDPVFVERGQAVVKSIDPPCHLYSNKNPQ